MAIEVEVAQAPDRFGPLRFHRRTIALGVVALGGAAYLLSFVTTGLTSRVARPGVTGDPLAIRPLMGVAHWPEIIELQTLVAFLVVGGILVWRSWRQRRASIPLLFFVAANGLAWLDPLGNWAPYASYDPHFLHWPDSWPWASLAPNVEPIMGFFGYFMFYMAAPALAVFVCRRLVLARVGEDSIVARHPLLALTVVTVIVGFAVDLAYELSLLHVGVFSYTQVPSWGSIHRGRPDQFPLLLQAIGTTIPFVAAALLWWRNSSGLTGAERLAQRWSLTRSRGSVGVFAVIFAGMSLGYLVYEVPYVVVRLTNSATVVARPWPWCATKVYDPNGRYRAAGEPGPYYRGVWPGASNSSSTAATAATACERTS